MIALMVRPNLQMTAARLTIPVSIRILAPSLPRNTVAARALIRFATATGRRTAVASTSERSFSALLIHHF